MAASRGARAHKRSRVRRSVKTDVPLVFAGGPAASRGHGRYERPTDLSVQVEASPCRGAVPEMRMVGRVSRGRHELAVRAARVDGRGQGPPALPPLRSARRGDHAGAVGVSVRGALRVLNYGTT